MAIYAKLNNPATVGGVVIDFVDVDNNPTSDLIDVTDLDPIPDVGWGYSQGEFIPPEPPARNKLLLSLPMFVDQFTDDEYELYLDVDTYDKKETKPEKTKAVKVKRVRDKLTRKGGYPKAEFIALAQVFVAEGVLTQARFDEILSNL